MAIVSSRTDGARSPDASLIDNGSADDALAGDEGFLATTANGLVYPLGDFAPAPGALHAIAPGVGWVRIPMPGSLGHINVWVLDDRDAAGDGYAIVDTGLNRRLARESWEALFAGALDGRRLTRVFATHCHPDHLGLAGWLCERGGVALWMTRAEWMVARMLTADVRDAPPAGAYAYWRAAGWDEAQIARAAAEGWGMFASVTSPLPVSYRRIVDGEALAFGDARWRVVVGSGHTPEHACLWNETAGVLIAGDQILPKISSNVSLTLSEPWGDPLGDWLASIDRLLRLPADTLVLPAHGEPFTGLHARLEGLRDGHLARLDTLAAHLDKPRRAVDCFAQLFRAEIGGDNLGMATGEAMAHLRRLEADGRATRTDRDGVAWFEAVRA